VPLRREVVLGGRPPVHAAAQAPHETLRVSPTARYHTLNRLETGGGGGPGTRRSGTGRASGQRLADQPSPRVLRVSPPGACGSSWRGARAVPPRRARLGGPRPATPGDDRSVAARGWPCPRAPRDGAGAPTRPCGGPLDRSPDLWSPGAAGWRGAVFVVRQHGQVRGERRGRPLRQRTTRRGPVEAQARRVRAPDGGATLRGRRLPLTCQERTRDGAPDLHVLADVPVHRASAAPPARLSGTRGRRETAWVVRTTTLSGAIPPVGEPTAAGVTCGRALWAYHAVSLLNAALRRAHGRQTGHDEVASASLAVAIHRTSDGLMMALPAPPGVCCQALSTQGCAHVWRERAASVNLANAPQQPRGPKKVPPERPASPHGPHVSTTQLRAKT
jgi:hypothetical protein